MSQNQDETPSAVEQESQSHVRDARGDNGQMVADEAYEKYLQEYHPDYQTEVYRVPVTTVFQPSKGKRVKVTESDKLFMMGNRLSHIRGDNAEKRVADSFEKMLRKAIRPAFIITNYLFTNFCNQKNEPPPGDTGILIEEGEHDILIISFDHGVFFIQIKGCERGSPAEEALDTAKKQIEKDKKFFTNNFKHFPLGVSIKYAIALPNLNTEILKGEYINLYHDHILNYQKEGLLEYLLDDDLPASVGDESKERKLEEWWTASTSDCVGFKSFDDYKRVIARYIGRKSTVKVAVINKPVSVRTEGECVAQIGNRYMNILLTPQQVAILSTGLRKLIIRGQYGTGKTILLILKMRQLTAERICILTMTKSPLIHHIEASVKDEISPSLFNKLSIVPVADQEQLKKELEKCREEKFHIFIDEVPSNLQEDESLSEIIKDYPLECFMWVVMSSERGDDLSCNLKRIFNFSEGQNYPDRFELAVLNKVVRCPPSIFPRVTRSSLPATTFGSNKTDMSEYFMSLGLSTPQMIELGNFPLGTVKYKWSDITVVDASISTETLLSTMLGVAGVPLTYSRNMADATKKSFEEAKKKANGKGTALFVNRLPENISPTENLAASVLKGGKIYLPNVNGTVQIKTQKELDEFLVSHGLTMKNVSENAKVSWSQLTFVEKPDLYYFLEDLGIPLVTPYDLINVLSHDAVLYTDNGNLEGFQRKIVLRVDRKTVNVNCDEVSTEGPSPKFVDHTNHGGVIKDCTTCYRIFQQMFRNLGLQTKHSAPMFPDDADEATSRTLRHRLHWSDVIVLDDRIRPNRDAADMLHELVPVEVKIQSGLLVPEDAFGYQNQVIYTTPENFKGLERKVVVVVVEKSDNSDLARSRCSSQLIVLKTSSDEESLETDSSQP